MLGNKICIVSPILIVCVFVCMMVDVICLQIGIYVMLAVNIFSDTFLIFILSEFDIF